MVLFLRRLFRDGAPAYHVDKETGERRLTGSDPAPAAYVAAAARYLREARADLQRAEGAGSASDLARPTTALETAETPHRDELAPATEGAAAALLARLVRQGDPLDGAPMGFSAAEPGSNASLSLEDALRDPADAAVPATEDDPDAEGERRGHEGAPC